MLFDLLHLVDIGFSAYNCLIHFYKRFQINSGATRPHSGLNQVLADLKI